MIVYPGFLGSDLSTAPMRRLLRWLGHDAQGWHQGRNLSASDAVLDEALSRIRALHSQHGRKISLVGWSLGGLYARELAKRAPEAVRCVVTLGSPFAGPTTTTATPVRNLYERLNAQRPTARISRDDLREPPPVPTTSIYSRTDGIVAWPSSVEVAGERSESIELVASHAGLGVNPLALYALADRLAQPDSGWRPFDRGGARSFLYPDPLRPAAGTGKPSPLSPGRSEP